MVYYEYIDGDDHDRYKGHDSTCTHMKENRPLT